MSPETPSGGTVDTQIKTPPIMNNPNNIDKYPNIPFGQFQGLIKHLEDAEIAARAQDIFLAKLTKKKTRIEASEVIDFVDNGRVIEVFYRVIDCCDNAQTDESGDNYTIEQALYKGRRINLTSRGEQNILTWLNEKNPGALKFQRA